MIGSRKRSTTRTLVGLLSVLSLIGALAATPAMATDEGNATPTPDIVVLKSASVDEIAVNGSYDYLLTVRNDGEADAAETVLIDNLDNELVIDGATPGQGSCDIATDNNQLACALGTLIPGQSVDVTINVTAGTDACGPVDNRASAAASNEPSGVTGNNKSERVVVDVICGSDAGVDVSVSKHVCAVQTQADFDAIGDFAAKLLACPVVTLPGHSGPAGAIDSGTAGLVPNGESAFNFTLTDGNGIVRSMANGDASFIPAQLCEIELGDLDGNPGTNLCLETSHYQFADVDDGETVIVELLAPDGYAWGTIEFTPSSINPNNDAQSLVSAGNGTVVLDTNDPVTQSDVMLHVFNFAELAESTPTPTPREGEEEGTPTPTPRGGAQGGNPTPEPRGGNLPNTAISETSQVPATVLSLILLTALTALVSFRRAARR